MPLFLQTMLEIQTKAGLFPRPSFQYSFDETRNVAWKLLWILETLSSHSNLLTSEISYNFMNYRNFSQLCQGVLVNMLYSFLLAGSKLVKKCILTFINPRLTLCFGMAFELFAVYTRCCFYSAVVGWGELLACSSKTDKLLLSAWLGCTKVNRWTAPLV